MIKTIAGFTLNHIYTCAYVAHFGVSFEAFSKDPLGTLEAIDQSDAIAIMLSGYRPLLPKQKRLQQINEARWRSEGHDVAALRASRLVNVEICYEPVNLPVRDSIDLPPASEPISHFAPSSCDLLDQTGTWLDHSIPRAGDSFGSNVAHSSGNLLGDLFSVNPSTGYPMLPGGMIDVTGTAFGASPITFG
ncbi:hypothetical protein DVT68_10660 [Dyella solisilvae]|uniref:Uncharacterized protein n=1 Tax=Dyella solisilvae TaxID=1920168 RepID=A0A370K8G5_9GAMM|nr:hypothetical protein [Dyella solisilvae]RDI98948.1 hypothetical protein DVT68_10660 [Dyella solisilvae]